MRSEWESNTRWDELARSAAAAAIAESAFPQLAEGRARSKYRGLAGDDEVRCSTPSGGQGSSDKRPVIPDGRRRRAGGATEKARR